MAATLDEIRDAQTLLHGLSVEPQLRMSHQALDSIRNLAMEHRRILSERGTSSGGGKGDSGRGKGDEGSDLTKLFVGNLPMDIRDEEVKMIFETYGKVDDVHIIDGKPAGTQKVGFVTYTTEEAADTAVQSLHDVYKFRVDSERAVSVSIARPKNKDKGGGKDKGGKGGGNDYKGGGGNDWKSGGDSDWKSGYNNDSSKGNSWQSSSGGSWDKNAGGASWDKSGGYDNGGDGKSSGYSSGGGGSYDRGGSSWSSSDYGGGKDKGGKDKGGKDKGGKDGGKDKGKDGGKGKGGKNEPSPRIHVSNLPKDIAEESLRVVFETYGKLSDIRILPARDEGGQMAAILVYSSEDEAETAISAMESGYEIRPGEGNINVSFARNNAYNSKGGKGDRYAPY